MTDKERIERLENEVAEISDYLRLKILEDEAIKPKHPVGIQRDGFLSPEQEAELEREVNPLGQD